MHSIVALGNPGKEYENTRHNAGRIVLEAAFREKLAPSSKLYRREIGNVAVAVLVPDTYMNESGKAVAKIIGRESADRLIVIYDDIALPLGDMKISTDRGDGGHNGLASVIAALGTREFARVRIGIAKRNFFGRITRPAGDRLASFVLSRFSAAEMAVLERLGERAGQAILSIINEGVPAAMNRFN